MKMEITQKSIASALDRAASRACHVNRTGASQRQCWFLAGLLLKAGQTEADVGCDILNTQAVLTAKSASAYIDDLLKSAKGA